MRLKKSIVIILVIFGIIQLIPVNHNEHKAVLKTDISKTFNVPGDVQQIFKTSCYDCHSNNTNYPWYHKIQPIGLFLDYHINNGKKELNFSTIGSYSSHRLVSKLRAINNQIKDGEMPLKSYMFMHPKAKLSTRDKALVKAWINQQLDSLNQ